MFCYRSDLQFTYKWETREDDPKLRNEPDSSLFNRQQGWEVLYLINKFGESYYMQGKAIGQKLEKMIRNHLPGEVRSQERVKQWLYDNWSRY